MKQLKEACDLTRKRSMPAELEVSNTSKVQDNFYL